MSIYRPRKPSNGKGAPSQFLMFCISVWEMLFNGKFPFQDTNTIKWKCGAAGYSAQWVNPGSSSGGKGGGDSWPPTELDTTVAHAIGDRVYISPGNILVTTGMIDLDSNVLTVALPGIWRAVTAVPAAVSSKYNVPQLPLPGASGAVPTGTPMKGDADGAQVHWLPEWINDYCAQNP